MKITLSVEHYGHLHKNMYSFAPFFIVRAYQQNQDEAITCNFLAVSMLRILAGTTQKEKSKIHLPFFLPDLAIDRHRIEFRTFLSFSYGENFETEETKNEEEAR